MATPDYTQLFSTLLKAGAGGNTAGAGGGLLSSLAGGPWGSLAAGGGLLFSLLQAANERRRYSGLQRKIQGLLDPENIYRQGTTDFQRTMASPAFGQARRLIFGAGQGLERNITSNAARAGLNTSGLGIAARAGAHSTIGNNLGQLTADAWQRAMEGAGTNAYRQASVLTGMPRQNDWGQLSGVGINALLAYLLKRNGGVQWPTS